MTLPGDPALRAGIGNRAGVACGLLGVPCNIAELCFLLPDRLVTADAGLPYRTTLEVFRDLVRGIGALPGGREGAQKNRGA